MPNENDGGGMSENLTRQWWRAYAYYAWLVLGVPMIAIAGLLLLDWLQHL